MSILYFDMITILFSTFIARTPDKHDVRTALISCNLDWNPHVCEDELTQIVPFVLQLCSLIQVNVHLEHRDETRSH